MAAGKALRVVIVGAGLMGKWHAYYAQRAGAIIAGVVDKDPANARGLLQRPRITPVFSQLEECLVRCNPDIVHVCTPTSSHFDHAKLALEAAANVLVEKPAAPTLDATETLLELAHRRQKLLNPVHQFPFQKGFSRLRANLSSLGEPVHVVYEAFTAGGSGLHAKERAKVLCDILPHPLSIGTSLFGTSFLKTVETTGSQTSDDWQLSGTAHKARFHVFLSHRGRPTRNALTYIGTEGTAHVNFFHGFTVFEKRSEATRRNKILQPLTYGLRLVGLSSANLLNRLCQSTWAYPGLPELTREFYSAVRGGGVSPIADSEIIEIARTVDRLRTA